MSKESIAPFEWVTITIINIVATLINIEILHKECKKRTDHRNKCTKQHNPWFKSFSLLTMISGVCYTFISLLKHLPYGCIIARLSFIATIVMQQVCMDFYQLSRLYFCFAKSKAHSNKGYPSYLFYVMYLFGILIILISILFPAFSYNILYCGINKYYRYYPKDEFLLTDQFPGNIRYWFKTLPIIYILWDTMILTLYVVKVCTFKQRKQCAQNEKISNRIMFILRRVLILTIFYEIPVFLNIIVIFVYHKFGPEENNGLIILRITYFFLWGLTSICLNISIFLMQQHNDNRYRIFLVVIHKLCNICCCFKYNITEALQLDLEYLGTGEKRINEINQDSPVTRTPDSEQEISIKHIHSVMPQLSKHTLSENNI
eukprot:143899_1